ncbi:MAG: T9SS type A sorting domain-containing protein [Bacteroidetes bacterium]|nr:MAG: T9SS type A sorting domain-containing protein [Bacteroidota bacterium]
MGLTIPKNRFVIIVVAVYVICFGGQQCHAQCWVYQARLPGSGFLSIAFGDSLHGIAGGYNGLLFLTSDGGITWEERASGGYSITDIEMLDANNALATANHWSGNYILSTTDGGVTWNYMLSPVQQYLKAVSFSSPLYGMVAGRDGTILRTADGGVSWTSFTTGYITELYDIAVTDSLHATTTGNEGKIFRTSDGGNTWSRYFIQENNTALYGVFFSDINNGTVVGSSGIIYHTTDGGGAWSKQPSNTSEILHSVAFSNSLRGVVVGNGTILVTYDGGSTWNAIEAKYDYYRDVALQGSQNIVMIGSEYGIIVRTSLTNCSFISNAISPGKDAQQVTLEYSPPLVASLSLTWQLVPFLNTDKYIVQLSRDSTFNTDTVEKIRTITGVENIFSEQYSNLSGKTNYYWRVALVYFNSSRTVWSDTWKFTTAGGSLSGIVFKDFNKDSSYTPDESGISSRRVLLSGKKQGEIITDSSGKYLFDGLDSGVYVIKCSAASPWKMTTPSDSFAIELPVNDSLYNINFGQYYPWNSVSGLVFYDENENGVKDDGESGVDGCGVRIKTASYNDTIFTVSTGFYLFPGLSVEPCSILVLPPERWEMLVPRLVKGYDIYFGGIDKQVTNVHFAIHPIPRRVKIDMQYHDNNLNTMTTIRWGVRPGATTGIWNADTSAKRADYSEGEEDLPPQIPNGYDVRLVKPPRSGYLFGNGSWVDMRPFNSPAQIDTYKISFTTGFLSNGSYPVTFSWSKEAIQSSYAGAVELDDLNGSIYDMKSLDSLVITDSTMHTLLLIASSPMLPPVGVWQRDESMPTEFILEQNYPNPFNPVTVIQYSVPSSQYVSLKIFNILGEEVATLVDGMQDAGFKMQEWDASGMPSGVYVYRLTAVGQDGILSYIETKKLLLLK